MPGKSSSLADQTVEAFRASPDAMAQSAALWEAVFEQSACGQLLMTPDGDIEAINSKACQLLGYAREALIGTRSHSLTHPGDLATELEHWRSLQTGHLPHFKLELRLLKQTGHIMWVEAHVSMLRDQTGQACQAMMIFHDITTRKHIERSLRERDALLRSLDHIPGAIYKVLLPLHGEPQLLYASSAAAQLYEIDPAATRLNWTTHYKRVHPDDLQQVTQWVSASLEQPNQPLQYTYRVITPHHGVRWLSGEAVAQSLPDGSTSWYGYTIDVTEQQQALGQSDQPQVDVPTPVATMVSNTDIRIDPVPAPAPTAPSTPPAMPALRLRDVLPDGHESPSAEPIRVLYAEDNEINVLLVEQVFKLRPQWELVVAANGQSALAKARAQRPDVMLVDMDLGDMSGLELMQTLDSDPRTQSITRVALSADSMPETIQSAQRLGFVDYLTKPLDVLALLRCLDQLLQPVSMPAVQPAA